MPDHLNCRPLAFLGGLAFGAVGMYFTGIVPHIELFNLPIFLFITPMFLFSGTFFPLEQLPAWAQHLALILPLAHLVQLIRAAAYNQFELPLLWSAGYFLLLTAVFFSLAVKKMRQRLIK